MENETVGLEVSNRLENITLPSVTLPEHSLSTVSVTNVLNGENSANSDEILSKVAEDMEIDGNLVDEEEGVESPPDMDVDGVVETPSINTKTSNLNSATKKSLSVLKNTSSSKNLSTSNPRMNLATIPTIPYQLEDKSAAPKIGAWTQKEANAYVKFLKGKSVYKSLTVKNKASYIEAMEQTIPSKKGLKGSGISDLAPHVIRPCYSRCLLPNDAPDHLPVAQWLKRAAFARYYLCNLNSLAEPDIEGRTFISEGAESDTVITEEKEFEVLRILSHTPKAEKEKVKFFLIQFVPDVDESLTFTYRLKGQISWEPATTRLKDTCKEALRRYASGDSTYFENMDQDTWKAKLRSGVETNSCSHDLGMKQYRGNVSSSLEKLLDSRCPVVYDRESESFTDEYTTLSFFHKEFMTIIPSDNKVILDRHILGKLHAKTSKHTSLNNFLRKEGYAQASGSSGSAKRIYEHFLANKEMEKLVILHCCYNGRSNDIKTETAILRQKHCYICVFERNLSGMKVSYFDPSIETNIYESLSKVFLELLEAFGKKSSVFKNMAVYRGYGSQRNDSESCFVRCLRFIALVFDGVDLGEISNFTENKVLYDRKMKQFKKSL